MTLATLRHVGIVVSDLTACQQFWENVFDFTVYAVADESSEFIGKLLHQPAPIKCKTVKLIGQSNVLIELLHFPENKTTESWNGSCFSTGITHIAFTVENLDSYITRLELYGFLQNDCAVPSSSGDFLVFYAKGPEGLILELVQPLK